MVHQIYPYCVKTSRHACGALAGQQNGPGGAALASGLWVVCAQADLLGHLLVPHIACILLVKVITQGTWNTSKLMQMHPQQLDTSLACLWRLALLCALPYADPPPLPPESNADAARCGCWTLPWAKPTG